MLQITPQSKIFVATQFVDFRMGFDSLAALCRLKLMQDPFSGSLFLFRNRRGTSIKVLTFDGQGLWLCTKRLSKNKITWWPKSSEPTCRLSAKDIQILLWNGDPVKANIPEDWRKIL